MQVLVLGATGFIGGHVALQALAAGWRVRGLRRNPSDEGQLSGAPVGWLEGDVNKPEDLLPAFEGIDVVFHCAGYYPADSKDVPAQVEVAEQQISHVLRLARRAGVSRIVYTSSFTTMVSGESHEGTLTDEGQHYTAGSMPRSAYYECKIAMEQVIDEERDEAPVCVILNPTMVLGPGGKAHAIGAIFLAVARGWGRVWLPARVNLVDVRDVAIAHIMAATKGRPGERYVIGGHNMDLRQLILETAQIAGVRGPRLRLPLALVDLLVWAEDHIPGINVFSNHLRAIRLWPHFSIEKARTEMGHSVRPRQDTLRDTLESYRIRGYL